MVILRDILANRADRTLKDVHEATHGLGIEVGYHKNSAGEFEMFCVAVLCEKGGSKCVEQSSTLILPEYLQEVLKKDGHIHDHVQIFQKNAKTNEKKILAETIRYRKPFITDFI